MHIRGLQKLTALDFPDKLAATVFTGGCNLRCPFCHNASLVLRNDRELSEAEVLDFLKKRSGVLDGVCITGGEPLLQPDLADFLRKIKELGLLIKLDTNGAFPEKLKNLISQHLVDYVAMDLKNSPQKYPLTCGFPKKEAQEFFLPFKKSIELLLAGKIEYEFRTTVVKELHTLSDIESAGKEIQGAQRWFLQCFQDSGDLISEGLSAPSKELLLEMRAKALTFAQQCEIRGI